MAIDTTYLDSDLDGMVADLPATFTLSGITGTGSITERESTQRLDDGGFEAIRNVALVAAIAQFSANPTIGAICTISYASVTTGYRVISLRRAQDNVSFTIDLEELTK